MTEQKKLIHRFWAGPKQMPDAYEWYFFQWQFKNPEWLVLDWNIECLEHFPDLKPVFDDLYRRDAGREGIELYVQLADVIGYALLRKWGGVYVNCDMQPVQPLPTELPDRAWASYENHVDGRIVNAAIGAPQPEDPFWVGLLDGLPERYFANPTDEMIMTTGPGYLTDYANQHRDQLHVFPVETFNPIHWSAIQPGGDASHWSDGQSWEGTQTIAVHHWGHKKDGRSNTVETATQ